MNTASGIQTAAPAGGVLVGEQTYRATADTIDYREAHPVDVKGESDPVPVWEAVAARSRASAPALAAARGAARRTPARARAPVVGVRTRERRNARRSS